MKANLSAPEWLMVMLFGVVIYLAFAVGIWGLWTNVMPYFWPDGPEEVTNPPFWMFTGALLLIAFVRRILTK